MASAATNLDPTTQPGEPRSEGSSTPPVEPDQWFDRSSITADVMVAIEGVSGQDWWRYAPEGRVCEYWDGVVYMPSPASIEHQDDVGFLFFLLSGYATRANAGHVLLGPGVLKLAPGRNPEPDIFVHPREPGPNAPPALLVVETLSPSTRSHDLGRKSQGFREANIPEIVHVDQDRKRLIVSRLADDLYTIEVIESGIWHSSAIPGFWVDAAWLWSDPLPDRIECLTSILAGPPA